MRLNWKDLPMSKKKNDSPKAPPPVQIPGFEPSKIFYGDTLVGESYKDGANLVTKYYPDEDELAARNIAREKIPGLLQSLNQTDPAIAQQYDQMAKTYVDDASANFMRSWEPTMRQTREDFLSRFGTNKATPYIDRVEDMFKNIYNPAMTDISRQGTMLKQDLFDQDQSRKLRQLEALGYQLDESQQSFLSGLNSPMSASQLNNNFNLQRAQQQLALQQMNMANRRSNTANVLGFLGNIF